MNDNKNKMPAGFNFGIGKSGRAQMTWSRSGLAFNRAAIELLGKPQHIAIGLDKKNKRLAIVGVDKDYAAPKYPFANTDARQKWLSLSASELRRRMRELTGKEPDRGGANYEVTLEGGYGIVELGDGADE